MRAWLWIAAVALLAAGAAGQGLPLSKLAGAIEAVTALPEYARMEWGILAEARLPNGSYAPLYARNAEQYFTPASNMKVVTTAPAFLYLGQEYATETPVWLSAVEEGTAQELCVEGRGDGSMAFSALQQMAAAAAGAGATQVQELVADASWFPAFPGSWEWEDLVADYGAQPSSFVLGQNAFSLSATPGAAAGDAVQVAFENAWDAACVAVVNTASTVATEAEVRQPLVVGYRIGDARVHVAGQGVAGGGAAGATLAALQPAERFLCAAQYALEQAGVTVQAARLGPCTADAAVVLGPLVGAPLVDMMNYTLQESDNLFAEGYLRHLGMAYQPAASGAAQARGIAAVQEILAELGVDTSTFAQVDGSGLSRHNLLSPRAMAEILELMDETADGAVYRSFLPVAGESGSLSNRFVGTPAQGVVEAKTGSMSGVNSLSGYVDARDDFPQIVFSILTNFSNQSSSTVRKGIDAIVVLFTQLVQG